jgi:hypothetical protein
MITGEIVPCKVRLKISTGRGEIGGLRGRKDITQRHRVRREIRGKRMARATLHNRTAAAKKNVDVGSKGASG